MNNVLDVIKASLWGAKEPLIIGNAVFEEMKHQAIIALPAGILSSISLSDELREKWKYEIMRQIAFCAHYKHEQSILPISVPYVILKGTSAAQYYPRPELRTMGDIDIITKREDYKIACDMLIQNGFAEITGRATADFGRHRVFRKNGIDVEVHAFFALLNDYRKARCMDELIIQNIPTDTHVLPDHINGLVILEHINQHLEDGIGLRQIVDWMMFVDKCLQNEKWSEFQVYLKMVGLEKLAITATRMCELYLGLPHHEWCQSANTSLCDELMQYVLLNGNFGNKRIGDSNDSTNAFAYAKNALLAFRLLQERGVENWKIAKRHKFFRCFAWVYQAGRYLIKGFARDNAFPKIVSEYKAAKQRNDMLEALEVKQISKGVVIYDNGEYKLSNKRP